MNYFPEIVANFATVEKLSRDIKDNAVPHALILEGQLGSGRHTIAKNLAAALSCKKGRGTPCRECISCRKIFTNNSPDVITVGIEGEKTSLGIETIRFLKTDIYTAPNDIDVKMYIVEDADKMTVQAQNAFLLSLEEPPSYVIFVLICESSSLLLETVRSRAPIMRTEKLSKETVAEYILSHDKRAEELKKASPDDFSELLVASDGSIGKALSLLDPKKRKSVFANREIARNFIGYASSRSAGAAFDLINSMGNKRAEVCERLVLIQYALRDLILLKKSDDAELCFYTDRDNASEISVLFTSEKLFAIYDAICNTVDDLNRNANLKLSLTKMAYNAGLL